MNIICHILISFSQACQNSTLLHVYAQRPEAVPKWGGIHIGGVVIYPEWFANSAAADDDGTGPAAATTEASSVAAAAGTDGAIPVDHDRRWSPPPIPDERALRRKAEWRDAVRPAL